MKFFKRVYFLVLSSTLFAPIFACAQASGGIKDLILSAGKIVALLIPIAAGLALLFFFWGLAKFLFQLSQGNEDAIAEGKQTMIWGVIALFVIVSIWGITRFLAHDLLGITSPVDPYKIDFDSSLHFRTTY